ncbi:MAG: hypothetical protein ABEI96_01945 [Haloarculaceae archaeon]
MTLRTNVLAVLAVLTLMVGAGAAAPANASTDSHAASQGPLGDLPAPVPDFVGRILDRISGLLAGTLHGSLGAAVSGVASANGQHAAAANADGSSTAASSTDDANAGGSDATAGDANVGRSDAGVDDVSFAFTVDRIAACGTTCRDVTVTLTSQRETTTTDVTVHTRVYAGNATNHDALVWTDSKSVDAVDAGGSYTTTERIDLSFAEAYEVQRADGWVTVETTVHADGETWTFTQHRQVA